MSQLRGSGAGLVVALVGLALAGCVTRAVHDGVVARNRALEHDLELREARIEELELQIRNLERTGESLELERAALTEERLRLLNEIEDLYSGNQDLREDLELERQALERREAEIEELSGTYTTLVERLEREVEAGNIEIHRLRGRLQVRALESVLFDSGRAEIKTEGREVLARVAEQLRQLEGHRVRVEGHTDSVPISNQRFPSNWELSAARAVTVVRFLIEQGLDPAGLSAEGLGPHQPIADNDTPEGRARNRRIEIVLVPEPGAG